MPDTETRVGLINPLKQAWEQAINAAVDAGLPEGEWKASVFAIYALVTAEESLAAHAAQYDASGDLFLSASGLTDGWLDMALTLQAKIENLAAEHAERSSPSAQRWAAMEARS